MNRDIILTVIGFLFLFTLFSSALTCAGSNETPNVNYSKPAVTSSSTIWVPDDKTTIQAAIVAANPGDTIQVRNGTYNESIVIDKNNLILIGESRENTIIDGMGESFVVYVRANKIAFSGFTVQNGTYGIWLSISSNNNFTDNAALNNQYGIYLEGSNYNSLSGNTVSSNDQYGILLQHSSNIVLSGNIALNNHYGIYAGDSDNNVLSGNAASNNSYGIYLYYSDNNVLSGNAASNNSYGVYFWGSNYNSLSGNAVSDNGYGIYFRHSSNNILTYNDASSSQYGIYLWKSSDNMISHSNFINNTEQISSVNSANSWDNAAEGNYWSDYLGTDAHLDGIGDTPYFIDENNQDNYPLMALLLQFNISTEGRSYKIDVVCNSTISDFRGHYDVQNRINAVSFKVNGTEGKGFCRICIPHALIEPVYKVTVDNNPPLHSEKVYTNGTHTWLYFTYEHSAHEVIVRHKSSLELVFLSQWTILGLMVTVVILLLISIHYYRLFSKQRKLIQAYEGELGSLPVSHSERARAHFIKDVIERGEKIEKFKKKYNVKIQPASTLEVLMEKLGVRKEKKKAKN